jgi:hypothetical protein
LPTVVPSASSRFGSSHVPPGSSNTRRTDTGATSTGAGTGAGASE